MSAPRDPPPEALPAPAGPPLDGRPGRMLLDEAAARAVLLVRAVEEADAGERVLDGPTRRRAGAAAADAAPKDPSGEPQPGAFVSARALAILRELERRRPGLRLLASGPGTARTAALAVAAGLALGLASNLLGPERRVHVLWNPVLLLVAWNLVVYLALLGSLVLPARPGGGSLVAPLAWAQRARARLAVRAARAAGEDGDESAVLGRAVLAASADQARALRPLAASRIRAALHLGAMAAALGALGGTYLRGLVLEYRATWESTFLSDAAAERVIGVLLGLARVTGIALPPLDTLRAPADGPAAPWIHALALTVLLAVVAPRTLLALAALGRARRLARAVPIALDAPYYRRLLAPARGEGVEVLVVPYATGVAGRALDGLRALLAELHGARASVRILPSLEYGAAGAEVELGAGAPRVALVFGLHQTPESEVHGRFLAELRARAEDLLVLVDASRYRAQLAPADARRIDERRRAWDAVAREAGCAVTHVDLEGPAARTASEAAAG